MWPLTPLRQLRYDAEEEDDEEEAEEDAPPKTPSAAGGEARPVRFLSSCRLFDVKEAEAAGEADPEEGVLYWRKAGGPAQPSTPDEEEALASMGEEEAEVEEDGDLDTWLERARSHVQTLPITEQQTLARGIGSATNALRTMIERLYALRRAEGGDEITAEDVQRVHAELRAEMEAERAEGRLE